ncbi:fused signal recognition particle receptor [Methanolinea mesophila]|uniref:signal recognition particle-docking protein FtsY n=1 Tax=Methanolinea mesophila TaxID=547055 RepID=UPI001AE2C4D1|nr:signal recognition particle-docking protein FtsY [Methanolinea mesophila]MBP1929718.1 fused signal recognition particle receptor [Methanolinea mesophila]
MFEGLKNRLKQIQGQLGSTIEASAQVPEGASASPESNKDRGKNSGARPEHAPEKSTNIISKVKVLITDREFVISEKDIEEPLFELEMGLLESDVALPVTEEIISHIRNDLTGSRRKFGESVDGIVVAALRDALLDVLGEGFDLVSYIREHDRPVKILFTGVNGTGKTTTVAKIGAYLKKNGFSVVIGAGDTFRAGAIEQIDVHATRLGIKVIQHQQGGDPSAVLFDAVQYANAHKIDVVLADTAGRFHNRANLMSQLEKIRRVMQPDLIVYVDEAVAGNDAVVRAFEFEKTVGADAVVLTKADMDSKGGAAISISHTIGKPLMFLGVGQGYDDIMPFSPRQLVDELLKEAA